MVLRQGPYIPAILQTLVCVKKNIFEELKMTNLAFFLKRLKLLNPLFDIEGPSEFVFRYP